MKKVLIGLVVVIVAFLGFVASRPDTMRVERSTTVAAPAEVVFANLNDFHNWQPWLPWNKLDPSMKKEYSGPTSGVGASYHWVGNDKTGEGKMTIVAVRPNERLDINLEFIKPWAGTDTVDFVLAPAGKDVKVTWGMSGHHNFMSKMFTLFMNMDEMIGKDYDAGLASLKAISEEQAKKAAEEAAKKAAEAEAAKKAAEAAAATAESSPANAQ